MGVTVPLLVVAGCGVAGEAPAPPPSCAAAFEATVRDLSAMFAATGAPATFPPAAAYVERCAALSLNDAQLRCLEPAAARADPAGCEAALAPRREGVEALAAWFVEQTALPDPAPPAVPPSPADRSQP